MKPIVLAAARHAAIFATICALCATALVLLQGSGRTLHLTTVISLVAICPLVPSRWTARDLYAALGRKMTRAEWLVLAASLGLFCGLVGILCQSVFFWLVAGHEMGVSLSEILFAPISQRYAIELATGLSFAQTALAAGLFAGGLSIPFRVQARGRAAAKVQAGP